MYWKPPHPDRLLDVNKTDLPIKDIFKEAGTLNISQHDPDFPWCDSFLIYRKRSSSPTYDTSFPPWWENRHSALKAVEQFGKRFGYKSCRQIMINHWTEKSLMVPRKVCSLNFVLSGTGRVATNKEQKPLLHQIELNYFASKHSVNVNELSSGRGMATGNKWWHMVQADPGSTTLHIWYEPN